MTNASFKNISLQNIVTIGSILIGMLVGIWNASQTYAELKSQKEDMNKEVILRERENNELKKEIILLREAVSDLEERTDDLEESRAYQEGKSNSDRTK